MRDRPGLLEYEAANALLSWGFVVTLVVVAVERALAGEYLWAAMAGVAVAATLVPPILVTDPREMVAWEVVALVAVPLVAPYFGVLEGGGTYLSVAALALVVAAELDAFTTVEMTPDFAVAFVVVVTMAVAGLWVIARYASDVSLGTSYLASQTAVMWDLIYATGAGLLGGLVFELYLRRVSPSRHIARKPWGGPR